MVGKWKREGEEERGREGGRKRGGREARWSEGGRSREEKEGPEDVRK